MTAVEISLILYASDWSAPPLQKKQIYCAQAKEDGTGDINVDITHLSPMWYKPEPTESGFQASPLPSLLPSNPKPSTIHLEDSMK